MDSNQLIPRGCQDRIGECAKCRRNFVLYLVELTMNGKTDEFLLCNECYEILIEIASDN